MHSPEEISLKDGSTAIQLRSMIRRPQVPQSLPVKNNNKPPGDPYIPGTWGSKSPTTTDPPLPLGSPLQVEYKLGLVEDGDETDEEVMEAMGPPSLKTVKLVKPNKSQVLFYLSAASNFRLTRVGSDIQVTDTEDFPLFDVWLDMDCCKCTWVVESYGRLVLLLHEQTNGPETCLSSRRSITITDWNGDVFGFLVPGDPFLLQNPEKQTVAKLIPHPTSTSLPPPNSECYDSSASSSTTRMLPQATEKGLCWLCVLEGSGRHIARLEDFVSVQYNKDVAFQLKLLTLAGIIRLSGPWMMPGRGESRHMMGSFFSFVSAALNCCAYCFY